jgi:hypothetical protein
LKAAAAATAEAYRIGVDFLVTQIGVPRAEIIPYSNQLTVLAEIFRQLPAPTTDQFRAIAEWFWRTSLAGYFGGWNTGMMYSDRAAVSKFAAGASAGIEIDIPQPKPDIWRMRTFRLNSAHAKLLAIVLAHHRPVDLLTGQLIDPDIALSWRNAKEFHHVFPQDYLKTAGKTANQINALANIVMLSSASNKKIGARPPSEYFSEVRNAAGQHLNTWASANLIGPDALDAIERNDYEHFIAVRSADIHHAVEAKAGWISVKTPEPAR